MYVRVLALGLFMALLGTCALLAGESRSSPVASIDADASRIEDFGADLHVELALSEPVPWRAYTLDAPRRLVIEFSEVDFAGADLHGIMASDSIVALTTGPMRTGWSRLVLELSEPYAIETAGLGPGGDGAAVLKIQLAPSDPESFAEKAGAPASALFSLPDGEASPRMLPRRTARSPLRVVLDPGHGGIDRGAEMGGRTEADLTLAFAADLRKVLAETGIEVVATREDARFVSLGRRIAIAEAAEADMLVSLHADVAPDPGMSGAAVYTWAAEAGDRGSARLAAAHDRADLAAGIDPEADEARIVAASFDAGVGQAPRRSSALADHLVLGLMRTTGALDRRPRRAADFAILRASSIPSVLIELGFLSDPRDLANLADPLWRRDAARGIAMAIEAWAFDESVTASPLRQ